MYTINQKLVTRIAAIVAREVDKSVDISTHTFETSVKDMSILHDMYTDAIKLELCFERVQRMVDRRS